MTAANNETKQARLFYRPPFLNMRIWLIRRLSGKHEFDKLTERRDKIVMHTAVDTMYLNLQKYVEDTLTASVTKLPQDMLALVIASNVHLSDLQKSQIASILETPSQSDNSGSYLG